MGLILFLFAGCSHEPPKYWPANGTIFRNIYWEIPIADSSAVLLKQAGQWILPEPLPREIGKTELSRHRNPKMKRYKTQLGRVDQEVVRGLSSSDVEFYRFDKGAVLLLGHTIRDTLKPLVVYDPPLVLLPSNIENLTSLYKTEAVTKTWNNDLNHFEKGQKIRIKIELKESGTRMIDLENLHALLCDMTISSDRAVALGETNLVVPDAMQMKSSMLIVETFGPVMEWGIRSRRKRPQDHEHAREHINREMNEKIELYIEATLHIEMDKTVK